MTVVGNKQPDKMVGVDTTELAVYSVQARSTSRIIPVLRGMYDLSLGGVEKEKRSQGCSSLCLTASARDNTKPLSSGRSATKNYRARLYSSHE
jgi:hypothetical protein